MTVIQISKKIVLKLLFLTPFGYILSLLSILRSNTDSEFGVRINFPKKWESLTITIKENPTIGDRINWLVNGVFLLLQVFYLINKGPVISSKVLINYGVIAAIFGGVQILVALFPKINFNKKIF